MRFGFFRFSLLINASSFFSKKIRDGDCFASLMIPLFAKNSRLGYFFNANNLLNDANEFIRSRLLLRIKFAYANLAFSWIASGEINSPIRDKFLVFRFSLLINASSFFSKKIRDWDCFAWRRRFSQSKFHFDFEDDLPLGSRRLWLLIPFLAKNSRLGYFFYARNPDPVIR